MEARVKGSQEERHASLVTKILVAQATLVLLFVALEVGVRLYERSTRGRPFFAPDTFISPWFPTKDYPPPLVDEQGRAFFRHRSEPVSVAKPPGVVRILAVGGSTTAGKRAFELAGTDYALELERLLDARGTGSRYEVLNAGADSFSSAHSLVNLYFRLFEFQPDVVLLMHNINDLSANYYGDGVRSDYSNKYLDPQFVDPRLESGRTLHGFLMRSRLLTKIQWLRRLGKTEVVPCADVGAGRAYFHRNLREIARLCQDRGVRLVLLSQPCNLEPSEAFSLEQFQEYNREVERVARETGSEFVDMFSLLGHDADLFLDAVHYTPEGTKAFARILAEAVDFGP